MEKIKVAQRNKIRKKRQMRNKFRLALAIAIPSEKKNPIRSSIYQSNQTIQVTKYKLMMDGWMEDE